MKHPVFVGHFDVAVRSFKPRVIRSLDMEHVLEIFRRYCDVDAAGHPIMAATREEFETASAPQFGQFVGQIGKETLLFKDGYLVCPWLDLNAASINFITELQEKLGVHIFEPGDGRYLTAQQLLNEAEQQMRPSRSAK